MKSVFSILGIVLFLIIILDGFVIIGGGERGVVFSRISGVQDHVLDEGFHFKKPFIDNIIKYEVRTTKAVTTTASTSFDQQLVEAQVVLNFHLNPSSVNTLYQTVGLDYGGRIISPALEGSIKAGMAKFKAEDLVQKRDEVRLVIFEDVKAKLGEHGIIADAVNIVDIDFSEKYDAAIEAKVEAEQQARKAENDLQRIQIEKEQKIVKAEAEKQKLILEAEGEAEAIRIKQEALTQSKEVLSYKWIETWNGELPRVMSGDSSDVMLLINQS